MPDREGLRNITRFAGGEGASGVGAKSPGQGWVGTSLKAVRLLCSSPLVEPAVRNSRNGLHRLHSHDGSQTVG